MSDANTTVRQFVELYGESAMEHVYSRIDDRLTTFSEWLDTAGLPPRTAQIHLGNAHIMLELLTDCQPYIFPEEVADDEDGFTDISGSTALAFKYFAYSNYIRRGPRSESERGALLESIRLYYDFLKDADIIVRVPDIVAEIISEEDLYFRRVREYAEIDEKFKNDEAAWIAAFEEWLAEYNPR